MESQNGQLTHTAAQNGLPLALERYSMIVQFIRAALQPGIDFGTIPGTGDRPTLLLPGAQKIGALFRFGTRLQLDKEIEDWTGDTHKGEPFFMYRHLCEVFDAHGQLWPRGTEAVIHGRRNSDGENQSAGVRDVKAKRFGKVGTPVKVFTVGPRLVDAGQSLATTIRELLGSE